MSDERLLQRARERLHREFPELEHAQTQIVLQPGERGRARYLVTFRGRVAVAGGAQLERIVRAVVDERGQIVKWSTSR